MLLTSLEPARLSAQEQRRVWSNANLATTLMYNPCGVSGLPVHTRIYAGQRSTAKCQSPPRVSEGVCLSCSTKPCLSACNPDAACMRKGTRQHDIDFHLKLYSMALQGLPLPACLTIALSAFRTWLLPKAPVCLTVGFLCTAIALEDYTAAFQTLPLPTCSSASRGSSTCPLPLTKALAAPEPLPSTLGVGSAASSSLPRMRRQTGCRRHSSRISSMGTPLVSAGPQRHILRVLTFTQRGYMNFHTWTKERHHGSGPAET